MRRRSKRRSELTLDFQGYNFWLTKLNQFNGNFVNADMVKAFITSSEYRGPLSKVIGAHASCVRCAGILPGLFLNLAGN